MREPEMEKIAGWIAEVLDHLGDRGHGAARPRRSGRLRREFPLYTRRLEAAERSRSASPAASLKTASRGGDAARRVSRSIHGHRFPFGTLVSSRKQSSSAVLSLFLSLFVSPSRRFGIPIARTTAADHREAEWPEMTLGGSMNQLPIATSSKTKKKKPGKFSFPCCLRGHSEAPSFEIAYRFSPYGEVGGDFADFFDLPDGRRALRRRRRRQGSAGRDVCRAGDGHVAGHPQER